MSDEELAAIERRLATAYASYNVAQGIWDMQRDITALVAEVRRLRALLAGAEQGARS